MADSVTCGLLISNFAGEVSRINEVLRFMRSPGSKDPDAKLFDFWNAVPSPNGRRIYSNRWAYRAWGTRSNARSVIIAPDGSNDGSVIVAFETRGQPPKLVVLALGQKFPDCTFGLEYEIDSGWKGQYTVSDGLVTTDYENELGDDEDDEDNRDGEDEDEVESAEMDEAKARAYDYKPSSDDEIIRKTLSLPAGRMALAAWVNDAPEPRRTLLRAALTAALLADESRVKRDEAEAPLTAKELNILAAAGVELKGKSRATLRAALIALEDSREYVPPARKWVVEI